MPLLEIGQTRRISTPGGSSSAQASYPQAAIVNAAESPEGEGHGGVEFVAPCAGKSVMHLEIYSQRANGAAHRKKYDTPPLKGYCQGTKVPPCEPYEISGFSGFTVPH